MHSRTDTEWDDFDEVFAVLGHETRLKILLALGDLERETNDPVSFSVLRQRVGVRDSSKFNFHLQKLTTHFVRRVDDRYRLRYVGRLVRRTVLAGMYRRDATDFEQRAIESHCYRCDARLVAAFDDGRLHIQCRECGDLSYRITIPPGVLTNDDVGDVIHAADQSVRSDITLVTNRVCPSCSGPTTASLRDPTSAPTANVYLNHVCGHCGDLILSTTVGELLLTRPAVVAFFYDRGVDLSARPCWELDFCVSDEYLTVVSDDPWLVRFDYPLDGDVLSVTMDEQLELTELTIESAETA